MKIFKIFILLIGFSLTSCEEVVQLDLETAEPRLVIEASIQWYKGSEGNHQIIKITKSTGFYEDEIMGVEGAGVNIQNEYGEIFEFQDVGDGIYLNSAFKPELNLGYTLFVEVEGEIYTAEERLIPVSEITRIEQSVRTGFGEDQIEIKAFYQDPPGEANYYLFTFSNEKTSLEIYEDEFTDGNEIFGYFSNEDIKPGDEIIIEMAGISRAFYEYLFILRSQVGNNGGGPFETQPATVKGNIVNETNRQNYPFGYFRLSEVDSTSYLVD
ncbi:DUF4249 domain-containing protein [Salegentibacter sp. HM20]